MESPDVEVKPMIKDADHSTSIPAKAPGYSPPHLDDKRSGKTLTVVNNDGDLEEVKVDFFKKIFFLTDFNLI